MFLTLSYRPNTVGHIHFPRPLQSYLITCRPN